ncbi:MAG: beta-ketoacyl-[acyl-carrier-protein] synthase family protein, partial [Gaiellaceae bacterium]
GAGQARAIQLALDDAGLETTDVDYINAHASSTGLGDATETAAIKLALGDETARTVPVSSIKGATGHCLGAAGAIEAAVTTLALRDQVLPPTINYETPDPACDLDYIPESARPSTVEVALSNSFGFGGHNAVLALKRWEQR